MKKLFHSLIVVVAAGLGLGVGFAWRGKSEARSHLPEARATAAATGDFRAKDSRPAGKFTFVRAHDDSPLATQLERDLNLSSGVTRRLYWLEGVERASRSDLSRLARLAHGDATATRLLASRWVELDVRHLFDTLAATTDQRGFPANELAEVLFEEWPRRDPDAAIAALSGTNGFGTRDTWRLHVASLLVEKDPERGLRALSSWRIDNFSPRMSGVAKWAAADPRHAAEFALAHPVGYASPLVMEAIGREWAKADPVRAMEFASSKPGELRSALANNVLKTWAGQNLRDAAGWLAVADTSTRHRLGAAFVEAWAMHDANGALAWCEANLSDASLAQAVGGVVKSAAQNDVTGAAGFVTAMQPSPARAEAAAAVARQWFPGSLSGKPVPPAAIAWMAGLDPDSARRALEQIQWRWSICDPKSMAEFLATTSSEKVPISADTTLARNLARQSPAEALAWASRLPAGRGLAAGGEAFAEWRRAQPESAMQWLNGLPSSDPRREPFLTLAIR